MNPPVRDIPKPAEPITDPRKLAAVLAAVVTNYPHIMARTGASQAITADGHPCEPDDAAARQFCVSGLLARATAAGAATEATENELLIMLCIALPDDGDDVSSWWEEERHAAPAPADFAALLRKVAAE